MITQTDVTKLQANDPRTPLPETNSSGGPVIFKLTDYGNAERLVARYGDELRYVPGLGWHAWDGQRWRRDADGEVMRRSKWSARAILTEAAQVAEDEARKRIVKWGLESEKEPRLRAAISLAQSERPLIAHADQLDADPMLFGCLNGTLDLRTGEVRPHSPTDLITLASPVSYDPDARCPRFERFVAEVFAEDAELIAFVQRFLGYCLTGDTREEVLTVFHGAGCNGKSTLLGVLKRLLGDYAVTAAFDTFMRARSDHGPRNDLARLHRARIVSAAESGEGRRLDEATVKELTGGDTIAARFLYGEHFEFVPRFKLVLVTNHRPGVDGGDDAIWRRLRLVPFEQSFLGCEDRDLAAKLHEELPGILGWAVVGCLDWQRHGLGEAKAVTEATGEYRAEEDVLGAFLSERCVLTGDVEVVKLRDAYESYCQQVGESAMAPSLLGRRLSQRGIRRSKRLGVYRGVALQ